MARQEGLDAVRFLKEGKKRYSWIQIPNDYQMSKYYKSFCLTISEATTGKNITKITK